MTGQAGPPLFQGKPSRSEPKDYSESEFEFLERVDRPYWARVRALIDAWFADFPSDRHDHLEKRLRSVDPRQFAAGFWELYLHAALKRSGLNVQALKEGKERTPDFEVSTDEGSCFIEATVVSGISDPTEQAERRRGVLLDAIDRLRSDRFTLDIHVEVDGEALVNPDGDPLPELEMLVGDVLARLADLDRLATAAQLPAEDLLLSRGWTWRDKGWIVTFIPILLPEAMWANHSVPLVGALSIGEASIVRDDRSLANKLLTKLDHYGGRFQPLLIAVHLDNPFIGRRVLGGLFGYPIELTADGEVMRSTLKESPGVFFTEPGRTLGGIAIVTALRPWIVARASVDLWRNPNANASLPELYLWPTHEFDLPLGPSRLLSSGRPPHLLFDLPIEWPGPEDPFG
jgi:hypothetical protein